MSTISQPSLVSPLGRISAIDSLRGILAWLVVCWHLWCPYSDKIPMGHAFFFNFLTGSEAVLCFFIISGFSVSWSVLCDVEGFSIRKYAASRFFRIYPVYVIGLLLMFGLTVALGEKPLDHPLLHWLLHAFMLHGAVPNDVLYRNEYSILGSAWSLGVEAQFYAWGLFLLLVPFSFRKYRLHVVSMVILLSLAPVFHAGIVQKTRLDWIGIQTSYGFAAYFLLGISCAFAMHSATPIRLRWFHVCAMGCVLVGTFFAGQNQAHPILLWLVVFGLVAANQTPWRRWVYFPLKCLENPWLLWLGRCSYSTYILHEPILKGVDYCYSRLGLQLSDQRYFFVTALVSGLVVLAAASACYLWIEKPLIQFGKKWTQK